MAKDIRKDVIRVKQASTRVCINVMLSSTELKFRRMYLIEGFTAMRTVGNDLWDRNPMKVG